MSLKSNVVAFTNGETFYIKKVRDQVNSSWIMMNKNKTVAGYSYEQALEWAYMTNSDYVLAGEEVTIKLG